jgi:DNA-binding LytR/AlgR family response regulator
MGQAVMSGERSGTDGGLVGTNGITFLRVPWKLFASLAGFLLVVIVVNISSHVIEAPETALWEPTLWEISSYLAIMFLVPAVYYGYQHFHWRKLGVPRFLMAQIVVCIGFSLAHIAIMVGLRILGYGLAHQNYNFAQGHLALELIYEGRKDALTFLVVCGFIWVYERLGQAVSVALPERIEVRSDGRTLYLTPAEILYAEAAGNYIELHLTTTSKPLLLRGTLTEYEKRLSAYGFARIHRSRLLNRGHMRSFTSTTSGDLRITLSDGRELTGSRRFRDQIA